MVTLHHEIEAILRDRGRTMTTGEIADAINQRGIYRKGDGTPVRSSQVAARISKHRELFVRMGSDIDLVGRASGDSTGRASRPTS